MATKRRSDYFSQAHTLAQKYKELVNAKNNVVKY
jgi:hypothetical protein